MNIRWLYLLGFFSLLIVLIGCSHPAEKSFYFWRSTYNLDSMERAALQKSGTLYVKVCDVVREDYRAKPVAVTIWKDEPLPDVNYIPVIFIDKDVFVRNYATDDMDTSEGRRLAENVFKLISTSWLYNKLSFNEIQIDCDWTPLSRKRYFVFLYELKKVSSKKIIATLRLDQIKNYKTTGVPPIDEGVLMAYNMGNLTSVDAKNSILSMPVLKQYINSKTNYPLPAKLALPFFEWKLLYQNENFRGILREFPDSVLLENFTTKDDIIYLCKNNFKFNERQFEMGDIIRVEKTSPALLQEAENYIRGKMKLKNETIYFDLSSKNLLNNE